MQVMERKSLISAVEMVISESPERNFNESIDMTVVFRNLDLKRDPKAKFSETIELVHLPGDRGATVAVIAAGEFALRAQESGVDVVLGPEDIERSKTKELKDLANRFDFFVAQADILPKVVRYIGPVLGPRNKMPTPIPMSDLEQLPGLIERLRRSVRARMKDQPVFHVRIASRNMDLEGIVDNAERVVEAVERKYESPSKHLQAIYVKSTMGSPIKISFKG